MIPELAARLDIAKRMPLARQRDVADTLKRIVEFDPDTFQDAVERQARIDEAEPIEFPDGFFEDFPKEQTVEVVEREPVYDSTVVTEELTHSIGLLAKTDEDRQRFAARMIDEMMRQDRFEVILTPEQEQDLKEQIARIDRGEERMYFMEEVMASLRERFAERKGGE